VSKRPVQVSFVGSADAVGSGGRFQACILLHTPGHDSENVLLDGGASSLIARTQQHHDPNQIGLVLLWQLHGDHVGGVALLVLDGQFSHRTRPLHVAGPTGVRQRVQPAMEVLFPGSTRAQRRFDVRFHELADRRPRRFEPGGWWWCPMRSCTPWVRRRRRCGWPGGATPSPTPGDTEWTKALVEPGQGLTCWSPRATPTSARSGSIWTWPPPSSGPAGWASAGSC
jgi:hypothetical protein